ncbi:MAG: hypothetical protein LUD02_08565 [Tannerellaceae bacterium]|nr:hypothetical protein [Tannerellaceae bacterium]
MELTYKYTTKDVIGGDYHATIISWKFNGTEIYKDKKDGFDKKVFITKSNGKTSVSFTR